MAKITFTTNEVTQSEGVILSNGNLFLAYRDADLNVGRFTIYDEDGTEVKAPTTFSGSDVQFISCARLGNGNVVVAYVDLGDSNKGKFIIYNSSGTVVVAATNIDSALGSLAHISVVSLDNGGFMVAFQDPPSNRGKVATFDSAGTGVAATATFELSATTWIKAVRLNNNNVFIVYRDGFTDDGRFVIYDEDRNEIASPAQFEGGKATMYCKPVLLNNDNVFIAYTDTQDSNYGKFVIYDEDGNSVKAITTFNSTNPTIDIGMVKRNDGDVLIAYRGAAGDGFYVVYKQNGALRGTAIEFDTSAGFYNQAFVFSNDLVAIAYYNGDGILYGFDSDPFTPPSSGPDITLIKRLIAIANSKVWYEAI